MGTGIQWTGERYIPSVDPEVCGAEIHYEHLHRYAFASQLVEGKTVLDLASGEGYGSYLLSKKAARVVGIDIDREAVEHARARYLASNLEFIECSILEAPIKGKNLFDVVVCFEAVEHVADHDQLLSEVKRLLKAGGIFIVSTPNKKTYSDDPGYHNPFHVKELYFHEFRDLLQGHFSNVYLFGQKIYASSNIWSLNHDEIHSCNEYVISKAGGSFSFVGEDGKASLYLIAIASDTCLSGPGVSSSYLIDVSGALMDAANRRISALGQAVADGSLRISALEAQYTEAQRQAAELRQGISERDARISALNASLHESCVRAGVLEHELNDMRQSVVWWLTMKYHNGVVERLLPQRTRRRGIYDLLIKSCRILANEGWGSFRRQYHERKKVKRMEREATLNGHDKDAYAFDLKDWAGEKIVFPAAAGSVDVSIVMPVFNKSKYTYNCLRSLRQHAKGSFELIVVDDASSDNTPDLLQNTVNVVHRRNEHNSGFIQSCNEGAAIARGKYLLFLNNDTVVCDGWLESMLGQIKKEGVGAVGAKLVYPDGKLQEAGGIIWNDSSGWNYGRGDDPEKPEYNFVRETDYCSGAALMVRKALFDRCGGFSSLFKPAYYEDTDLCFSLRGMGYKVIYQPMATVVHFEGVTSGKDVGFGVKRYQAVNKDQFFEKWHDTLLSDHYPPDAAGLFLARSRKKGLAILVIDHFVPTFDRDSGSYRMFNILKILSELGHNVTFIGDNLARMEPYTSALQQEGVEVVYGPYTQSLEEYLSHNGRFFDVAILSRAHIADKHIMAVRKYCDNASIIFDTVDLQFLRERRRSEVEHDPGLMEEADRLKDMEFRVMALSDITLVVSPVEKEIINKDDSGVRVEILSNIHRVSGTVAPFSTRRDLMFIGGFMHPPNVDAVKWFVRDIFPLVKEKIPGVRFYVVGSEPPEDIKSLASDDVVIAGYVEDPAPYFEKCRVFVAPLRYGAGVKGKINQSMSYGLPVVTTPMGAEGMGLEDGANVLIAGDAAQFASMVIELYGNEELWHSISVNSTRNVELNYSYDVAKEKLKGLVGSLGQKGRDAISGVHDVPGGRIKEASEQ